jgi:hypothetical protein
VTLERSDSWQETSVAVAGTADVVTHYGREVMNVPIAVVALVASLRILPRDVPKHDERLDWLGLVLLSPSLAGIIYGLAESGSSGGFGSAKVLVPILAGVLVLATFVWHALRSSYPLIDLRLFKNRVFTVVCCSPRRASAR